MPIFAYYFLVLINWWLFKAEEKGVESLFHCSGTVLSKESFQGISNFEVVSYLIILDDLKAEII